MSKAILRIIFDLMIMIAVIKGWWFLALPFGIVGVWLLPYFFEIIIAGIAYDALFGIGPLLKYAGLSLSVIVLLSVINIKKIVK